MIQNPDKFLYVGLGQFMDVKNIVCYIKKDITCFGQNYYPIKIYTYIQKLEPEQLLVQRIRNNTIYVQVIDKNYVISINRFYKLTKHDNVLFQSQLK